MPTIPARDVQPGALISVGSADRLADIVPVTRVVTIGDRTTVYRRAPHWTQPEAHIFPADRLITLLPL